MIRFILCLFTKNIETGFLFNYWFFNHKSQLILTIQLVILFHGLPLFSYTYSKYLWERNLFTSFNILKEIRLCLIHKFEGFIRELINFIVVLVEQIFRNTTTQLLLGISHGTTYSLSNVARLVYKGLLQFL